MQSDENALELRHALTLVGLVVLVTIFGLSHSGGITSAQVAPRLIITPQQSTVDIGDTVTLTAYHDPNGCYGESRCVGVIDVTNDVAWSHGLTSDESSRVSTNQPGIYVAQKFGNVLVSARYGGLNAGATISVNIPPEAYVYFHVQGAPQTVAVGETFDVSAIDDPNGCASFSGCFGTSDVTTTALWSSSNVSVIRSLGGGRFEAVGAGTASVMGSYGGRSDSKSVTVTTLGGGTTPPGGGTGGQYDVVHVKRLIDSQLRGFLGPIGIYPDKASQPWAVEWLSGGYFVVSSATCHIQNGQNGTWVFDRNGNLVEKRHGCIDSLAPGYNQSGLNLGLHAWNVSPVIRVIDATRFLRHGATVDISLAGYRYPIILYQVSGNKVNLLGKNYALRAPGFGRAEDDTSKKPPEYDKYGPPTDDYVSYAGNNMVIVRRKTFEETGEFETYNVGGTIYKKPVTVEVNKNILYSLPNFDVVREWEGNIYPIGYVGGFVISRNVYENPPKTRVYRVNGTNFELVQTLDFGVKDITEDTLNSNRVGFMTVDSFGDRTADALVYTVGTNGLTFEKNLLKEGEYLRSFDATFGLAGDYFARTTCGDSLFRKDCSFKVSKNGMDLTIEPIPPMASVYSNGGNFPTSGPGQIVISPTGEIVGVGANNTEMFKIQNFGGVETPPGGTTGGTGGTLPLDYSFLLDLAERYQNTLDALKSKTRSNQVQQVELQNEFESDLALNYIFSRSLQNGSRGEDVRVLQVFLNSDTDTYVSLSGAGSEGEETDYFGPATESAVQRFQCKTLGICSGSPSSNGYGRVGPQTRATINAFLSGARGGGSSNTENNSIQAPSNGIEGIGSTKERVDEIRSRLESILGE